MLSMYLEARVNIASLKLDGWMNEKRKAGYKKNMAEGYFRVDKVTWIRFRIKKSNEGEMEAYSSKSNQISFSDVGFAVKTSSVTPLGRYQCTTQSDRDVGSRD